MHIPCSKSSLWHVCRPYFQLVITGPQINFVEDTSTLQLLNKSSMRGKWYTFLIVTLFSYLYSLYMCEDYHLSSSQKELEHPKERHFTEQLHLQNKHQLTWNIFFNYKVRHPYFHLIKWKIIKISYWWYFSCSSSLVSMMFNNFDINKDITICWFTL